MWGLDEKTKMCITKIVLQIYHNIMFSSPYHQPLPAPSINRTLGQLAITQPNIKSLYSMIQTIASKETAAQVTFNIKNLYDYINRPKTDENEEVFFYPIHKLLDAKFKIETNSGASIIRILRPEEKRAIQNSIIYDILSLRKSGKKGETRSTKRELRIGVDSGGRHIGDLRYVIIVGYDPQTEQVVVTISGQPAQSFDGIET